MSKIVLVLDTPGTATDDSQTLNPQSDSKNPSMQRLINYIDGLKSGARTGTSMVVKTGAVAASGTITFSALANNDTVTINSVVFTAKTSGATGNQFNLGSSDTDAATNLAAVLNASAAAGIVNVISASSNAAVVTITAQTPGVAGNNIGLAISAHGTVSAATLASGSEGTKTTISLL